MRVRLLGTGSADGWPNAWCSCASCAAARAGGDVRGTTSALLDDVVLVDCGPDTERGAVRCGADLTGVRVLLLTHAHHDHLAPGALLSRSWALGAGPLHVLGPASAIEACRPWVGPHDPVRLHVVAAGDDVDLGEHGLPGWRLRVHAAAHDVGRDGLTADAVLHDVTSPEGRRVLCAWDTGPLPEATLASVRGAAYDVVLLEETFGHRHDHGTGHLDLATFPVQLRRLREAGAVTGATTVLAVHLGHHNPPGPELDRVLAAWGARAGRDGEVVVAGAAPAPQPAARRTLLVGGARSGKSAEAERRLLDRADVTYVATGADREDDPEWRARVAVHRARRPLSWTTVETGDVAAVLRGAPRGAPVLVDCLALWLAGVLDRARVWDAEPGTPAYAEALAGAQRGVDDLVDAVAATAAHVVLVSNEVGSGVVPAHASGRLYRDLLGTLNARVSAVCDEVDLVVAGRVLPLVAAAPAPPSAAPPLPAPDPEQP
ncbi:MAG: MBL fold metallo-hydrolase [Frankiales bacterium]|nr:MBL fold metallo-hydrolase [Frankiales bacterium]